MYNIQNNHVLAIGIKYGGVNKDSYDINSLKKYMFSI
jgi:hypothetical protein